MSERQRDRSDALLKAYYAILREMGPDSVLEERIREQESLLGDREHEHVRAS